jgi:predicted nucleic acid-binding protein
VSYPLVFIDTNIFLDFYRARGSRDKLSILDLIDNHHDRIITGDQVRMEFSKNRQRVILESVQGIKLGSSLSVPSILAEATQTKAIEASQKQADKWLKTLQKRLGVRRHSRPLLQRQARHWTEHLHEGPPGEPNA